ncbi:MAG TPA: YcjX family protein [Geminicoccaceae bacterium]|nr:YcjX family protein [Geminicoccaceae bacterium]
MVTLGVGRALAGLWDEVGVLGERARNRHLRLAVTGLRRSGKTVFITSLVHHLLDGHGLPFVQAVHDGRYLGARLHAQDRTDAFPYRAFHAELTADPPRWPKATERLATLRLELAYRTTSLVLRQVQPIQHLTVEIIDYPGEWLLDLPLLDQSFETFAAEVLDAAARPPRAALARPWLDRLAALDLAAAAEEAVTAELALLYTEYLRRCHGELGLSVVQPGRFTNPGDLDGSPLLRFCPVPPGPAPIGSLRQVMADRFQDYKEQVVQRFYRDHFSRFDRQIVLVDLLASLNAGPWHFADTEQALAMIMKSFRYGTTGWLARLFSPTIDRLLFAVSKADHVAHNQHANLKQLMERMIQAAARTPRFEGVPHEVLAIAALRCTDTVRTEYQGQLLSCVRGRLLDENRETVLFPGEIPPDLPEPDDWSSDRFRFRQFAPRRLRPGHKDQHIRLDQAIEFLLGDKLR